jgi:hypothetical protein
VPRWQFIASFLAMVLGVIIFFFVAQNQWVKGQMQVSMD